MISAGKTAVQKQEDVMQLRDRVDHLDCQQQQQLEELRADPTYIVDRVDGGQLFADDRRDSPARSVDSDHDQSDS